MKTPTFDRSPGQTTRVHAGQRRAFFLCPAILFCLTATAALAQSDAGHIDGSVFGPSGAGVANVTIVLTELDTKVARTIQSSPDGTYLVPKMLVGSYELTAKADGFQLFKQKVYVVAGARVRVNLRLDAAPVAPKTVAKKKKA